MKIMKVAHWCKSQLIKEGFEWRSKALGSQGFVSSQGQTQMKATKACNPSANLSSDPKWDQANVPIKAKGLGGFKQKHDARDTGWRKTDASSPRQKKKKKHNRGTNIVSYHWRRHRTTKKKKKSLCLVIQETFISTEGFKMRSSFQSSHRWCLDRSAHSRTASAGLHIQASTPICPAEDLPQPITITDKTIKLLASTPPQVEFIINQSVGSLPHPQRWVGGVPVAAGKGSASAAGAAGVGAAGSALILLSAMGSSSRGAWGRVFLAGFKK